MSKVKAQEFKSRSKYVVIGMVSCYDNHPQLQEGYIDYLKLKFYDMDFATPIWPGITSDDAEKILDFAEEYKNKVDLIVVHCNAGISRSSGAAAALSLIYNGDDNWIFKDLRYMPNMRVYRKILEAADKRGLLSQW